MTEMDWQRELLPFAQAVDELVVKFNGIKRDYIRLNKQCPIEQVSGRVKRVSSILEKANRRNIPADQALERLEDIAGVRIICRFVSDIQKVVEFIRLRDGIDMSIIQEEDYVTNRKESGYRSYHITIKYPILFSDSMRDIICELQIRTMSMNFWATIEHSLRYKYEGKLPNNIKLRLQRSAEAAFQLDQEMDMISEELLSAQKTINNRESVVDKIIDNIHKLNNCPEFDNTGEYNNEFINLYREGNIDKLNDFNDSLTTLVRLYNNKRES